MVSKEGLSRGPSAFFGGVHARGVNQVDSDRLLSFAEDLLISDASDEEAVAGLRAASGRDLRALQAFTRPFEHHERPRRSRNDPLVHHVEALAAAARDGSPPPPVSSDEEGVVEQERQLLKLPLPEAFSHLASRCPELAVLAEKLSDPVWIEGVRTDPGLDSPRLNPPLLPPLAGLKGILARRMWRRIEQDPRYAAIRSVDQGAKRLMTASSEALRPVIRLMEESDDPLLRTLVAQHVVVSHLGRLASIPAPFLDPWPWNDR